MPLPDELREQLPENLRDNEQLNRYDSLEALGTALIEQRQLISRSIRIPGEDAGEEARKEYLEKLINHAPELTFKPDLANPDQAEEFYRTMGKPEAPDQYENPEEMTLPADVESELRNIAINANMTNAQYQKMVSDLASMETKRAEAIETAKNEDAESLKGKWGQVFEERESAAQRVCEEYFPGMEFENLTADQKIGLYNVHAALTGGKPAPVAHDGPQPSGRFTPEEAKRQADEIMRSEAWFDRTNPTRQRELQEKVVDLLSQAGYTDSLDGLRSEGRASF